MSTLGWLRKRLFGISPKEATSARRGFRPASPAVQLRFDKVGQTFLDGYGFALETSVPDELALQLNRIEPQWRGFAFEGSAMALGLFDFMTPWRRDRFSDFLREVGDPHTYMLHVGLGWAAARVPWVRANVETYLQGLDPLLRWLVLDGYGFHQGYFHWPEYVRQQRTVPQLSLYARRAFDQGLGRSLWFVESANVSQVKATIADFEDTRQPDLWSGIGLACTYAGGAASEDVETLRDAAPRCLPQIAQGAAFAAKVRQRAGNPAEHTELACRILCGLPAEEAAAVTDRCLQGLADGAGDSAGIVTDGTDNDVPAYEQWRRRVQEQLVANDPLALTPAAARKVVHHD